MEYLADIVICFYLQNTYGKKIIITRDMVL